MICPIERVDLDDVALEDLAEGVELATETADLGSVSTLDLLQLLHQPLHLSLLLLQTLGDGVVADLEAKLLVLHIQLIKLVLQHLLIECREFPHVIDRPLLTHEVVPSSRQQEHQQTDPDDEERLTLALLVLLCYLLLIHSLS